MLIQRVYMLVSNLWLGGAGQALPAVASAHAAGVGAAAAPANNGFALAAVVMAVMVVALLYALISIARGQGAGAPGGPAWIETAIPVVALLGMGVAAYLTFVETQNVSPVCGPVGDCGSVQASPYARLFGVFPVGLLGLLGYIAILAAWAAAHFGRGVLVEAARVAAFGMAVFGVLFSIYLTYLELWVIRAVCIWCLSSAVFITASMLLTLPRALLVLQPGEEEEADAEPI